MCVCEYVWLLLSMLKALRAAHRHASERKIFMNEFRRLWQLYVMWSKSHRVPGISIEFLPLSTSSEGIGISISIGISGISWHWPVLMSYHSSDHGMCRLLAMLCKQCCLLWQRKLPHTRRRQLPTAQSPGPQILMDGQAKCCLTF